MKKILKFLFSRAVIVSLLLLIQFAIILVSVLYMRNYLLYYQLVNILISFICGILILNSKGNSAYKIAWVFPIVLLPLFGALLYLIFGGHELAHFKKKKMMFFTEKSREWLLRYSADPIKLDDPDASRQSLYLHNYAYCPAYNNTEATYFPSGESKLSVLLSELEKAEKYIFMEYFIIRKGSMWDDTLEVLKRKAAEGVDVRIIYDDFGCLTSLPSNYKKTMSKYGIKCAAFNPYVPIMSPRLNNRDHRKICVIDGKVGFTGGINFSDEYVNRKRRCGHWKDTAVMVKGDAAISLLAMILQMWEYTTGVSEDLTAYLPEPEKNNGCGYVQPYTDNPIDDEPVGQNVYLNMINAAKKYIWITTPYLIIEEEMITALTLAAKSGIDVRIITPAIPEKRFIFTITRANYAALLAAGVKIYEYTPGFIHAKMFVCDDVYATVGTVNLDYRSLFLHFECGVWMYKTPCIIDIKTDIAKTLRVCEQIPPDFNSECSFIRKAYYSVIRSLAPLL